MGREAVVFDQVESVVSLGLVSALCKFSTSVDLPVPSKPSTTIMYGLLNTDSTDPVSVFDLIQVLIEAIKLIVAVLLRDKTSFSVPA